jgi:hypothetical protein
MLELMKNPEAMNSKSDSKKNIYQKKYMKYLHLNTLQKYGIHKDTMPNRLTPRMTE